MSKLVVANLKMNLVISELKKYIGDLNNIKNTDVVICPPSIYLPYFLQKGYSLGVQNISSNKLGNYTGEISSFQVSNMGVKYALIGHLEVRQNLKETDEDINNKIKIALKNNIIPILCVGESLEEKQLYKTERVLKKQIISGLREVKDLSKVIIAYDPLWKINKSDIKDIEEIVNFIKDIIELNFKQRDIKVIVGGVTDKNIDNFKELSSIDGYLIGEQSIEVGCIEKIIEVAVS